MHFQSQSTWDLLKILKVKVFVMDGDHALKLCDIFSYNRFFDFQVLPSFPVMTTNLWGVFSMSHKIPFHLNYVVIPFVLCISEEKNSTRQTAGTDVRNGLAPHQTATTFYRAAFRAHKCCCIDRADRVGLQADLSLLHGEDSHVELRLEKEEPEGCSHQSPAHGTSPALPAILSG